MSNVIYSSDAKLNFQHHPSEISLIWSTFDYQCWKQLWYLFIYFLWKLCCIFLWILWWKI